jgi:DNA-binding MarR family transcriptional regulator
MNREPSGGRDRRERRRTANAIQMELRDLLGQLSILNHWVSARLGLKDADLNCLELIGRLGPISPSALAKRAGVHPATMTGMLDRLERDGWIARDRDPADRRAVLLRVLSDRANELYRLYAGMREEMNEISSSYDAGELAVIHDFLRRCTDAGERAAQLLGESHVQDG